MEKMMPNSLSGLIWNMIMQGKEVIEPILVFLYLDRARCFLFYAKGSLDII